MLGLRSLRNRLAVVFGLIVFGAVGTIYLTVTPRLEERLQEQKLERLQSDAARYVDGKTGWAETYNVKADEPLPEARLKPAAADISAEVLVLDVLEGSPVSLSGQFDSAPDGGITEAEVTPLARDAVIRRRPVSSIRATPSWC